MSRNGNSSFYDSHAASLYASCLEEWHYCLNECGLIGLSVL